LEYNVKNNNFMLINILEKKNEKKKEREKEKTSEYHDT
jgi:hypothetical protein